MPDNDGGSPIEAARHSPEAMSPPDPEFVRDPGGVEVAYRGKVTPTQDRIKRGPLSYGRVEHFGDGVRKASRAHTYRAPDLMVTMLASGTIDLDMAQAGRAFRSNFHTAGYTCLQALDPGRIPGTRGPGDLSDAAIDARRWIAGRLAALGGHGASAASAAWFVLGEGYSIRRWATERQCFGVGPKDHLSRQTAGRMVIGILEILAQLEREDRE